MARPGAGVIVVSAIVLGSVIFVATKQAKQANAPEEHRPKQEENRAIPSGIEQAKDRLEQAKQQASTQDRPLASSDSSSAPAGESSARNELSGTIAFINPDSRTVAIQEDRAYSSSPVQSNAAPTQLTLDEDVKVLHGDQQLSLADLHVGDRVKIQMQTAEGGRTVQTIMLNAPVTPIR